mmetsp:Transcript_8548/g.13104  ORF Transcript_8548/g.13104 Transcript_8548/m.13104 type:complete len:313 (-) Transcript_8548:73-1011(-)|eukprot:CAMPEP_0195299502 /NCGR_PEP_ID=MMETSP0707-20130614/25662_1 /TAXON_ID=33640 /ORGANISM="Asterionellopsis glacialis, Strain CCMP134" /LENGTH=312 /DNA_ID=CAMNT_0040361925 /DNA_START=72 /DNA_END=1010 /DNA_ORIENTATION=+
MAEPTNAELTKLIKQLVHKVDLDETSPKKFIALLSKELGGIDLTRKKKFIKETVRKVIESIQDEEESSEEEAQSEEEEEPKPRKRKGGGGLAAVKEISRALANLLGKGKEMARTEVVKELWNYIREHELQDPTDKRKINLDENMQEVFGTETFTMFSMNKYVSAHIHPFKPVDLTPKEPKKRKAKQKKGKNGDKKARKSGTQAPYQLSPELTRVVGKGILPRPQVTQALWAYIRENSLQNPEDKREILCDTKLKAVMGGKNKVTMFTMNKYITPHMLEKLDKSYYTHPDEKENAKSDESETDSEAEQSDDEE